MSIDVEGFLSKEVNNAIPSIRKQHEKWFAFAEKLNRLCQTHLWSIKLAKDDDDLSKRQMLAAPVFARCVSGFQGVILLCERGMTIEARCLARTILEATFVVAALQQDEGFFKDFVQDDLLHQKKMLIKHDILLKDPYIAQNHRPDAETALWFEQAKTSVERKIADRALKRRRPLSTEDIAKRGGMHGLYLALYSTLSQTVHSIARDLDRHFTKDEQGELDGLCWAPGIDDIDEILIAACDTMFNSLARTMELLDQWPRQEFDALWAEWVSMKGEERAG